MLVRKDLSLAYRAVQGGHAVAQWIIDHPGRWENEYLIYLDVQDVCALERWKSKLDFMEVSTSAFYEPDLDNELTSVSCVDNGRLFRKLNKNGNLITKGSYGCSFLLKFIIHLKQTNLCLLL